MPDPSRPRSPYLRSAPLPRSARSGARSRPALGALLVAVLSGGLPLAVHPLPAQCPHQGRDPATVVVDPTTSPVVNHCSRREHVQAGGVSGASVTAWACPTWETTGVSYNPAMAKPHVQITDSRYVENKRIALRCARPVYFWGLYSNIRCESYREDVIEVQLHVIAEAMCPESIGPVA